MLAYFDTFRIFFHSLRLYFPLRNDHDYASAVQNPSASPELNLHLSEDEDDLNLSREGGDINNDSDEVDVVVIDIKDRKKSSRIDQEGTGACAKSKPQIGSQELDGNNNGQMAQSKQFYKFIKANSPEKRASRASALRAGEARHIRGLVLTQLISPTHWTRPKRPHS